ncbi:LytR C-terminal domain-containing protein [Herbaspirillum sp. ST 5-3]|uniref:LytR C-terminal domain-containing protein n=1 Tax=Oxalobacteraceae TaxID=75682 RepID=UPI0010A50840|nr:LytR C-terminal domain-containing protein [Herbaspirillum sp. ST 5-3]
MKRILRLLPLASSIPLLLSCSTFNQSEPKEKAALRVEPVFAIRHAGSDAQDYYQLGRYYQGQQRFDLAIDAYRKALDINMDFVEAHNAIATSYAAQGEYDKAIAEFLSALNTAPQAAHLYNNLGYTYFLQKNYVSAVAAYDKALALDSRNARTANNLAQAYTQLNEDERSQIATMRAQVKPVVSASPTDRPTAVAEQEKVQPAAQPAVVQTSPIVLHPDAASPAPQLLPVKLEPAPARVESNPLKPVRLEISNGNGINGMAKKAANALAQEGIATAHLTNQKPFRQLETVIQYREGFREQAVGLSQKFVNPPSLLATTRLRGSTDVRLVLGWDLRGSHRAVFVSDKAASKLALDTPHSPGEK